jgi:hypothetical protein
MATACPTAQVDVASCRPSPPGAVVTLEARGHRLQGVEALPAPTGFAPATFPWGLYRFNVADVTPGGVATVRLLLPAGARPNAYAKPDPATGQLARFDYDGTTGAEIAGNVVTLHLMDGGRGDADGLANGVIVDPGGPGELPVVTIEATDPTPPNKALTPASSRSPAPTTPPTAVQSTSMCPAATCPDDYEEMGTSTRR